MLDQGLVHALVDGEDPDCRSTGLRVDVALIGGHGIHLHDHRTSGLAASSHFRGRPSMSAR